MRAWVHKSFVRQAAFGAACCWLLGCSARGAAASALPAQAPTHFAIADFDGDSRPDLASVHVGQSSSRSTRYWIAFHLSGGTGQTGGITAATGGLLITTPDVKADRFADVNCAAGVTKKTCDYLLKAW